MAEVSIALQEILLKLKLDKLKPWGTEFELFDIGARTGTGSNLLGLLFKDFMPYKVNVTPVDRRDNFEAFSNAENIHCSEYVVADVFDMPDGCCDFVVCSHTLEHTPNPYEFARKIQSIAKYAAIIYCPYNEINPIQGHRTIAPELIEQLAPAKSYLVNSYWWGHGRAEGKLKNIMIVLNGSEGVDFADSPQVFAPLNIPSTISHS